MTTEARLHFSCCDTRWLIHARGPDADAGVRRGESLARAFEARLSSFDERSAVSQLNREGRVEDPHVAALVARAQEYRARTGGVFDIAHGRWERAIKDVIRGQGETLPPTLPPRATYAVRASRVTASGPLDLNGLAKGYIVDRVQQALAANGLDALVDGGGDIAHPIGPVGIASPVGGDLILGVLDTDWSIATSGTSRRTRGHVTHLYDARDGTVGASHEQVTVVARRDCMEADALATTLAVLPLREGLPLVEAWDGAEALWVHRGRMYASSGFEEHVRQA